MPLTPGARLGPYEVTAKLGAGGMGEVYRARDTKLNRDVALKILPEAFTSDADRLARFRREAQVLASLNQPNIAAIYGFEDSGATHALVMELVEGEDLSKIIARGAMPIAESLPIARQIAEALEAAHEQGIIHRDLKPANIKVRPDGAVKVLDFGLAKALVANASSATADAMNSPTLTARATEIGTILGTAAYMAPEQARGKVVGHRADVWAFGCVLYEMLTGARAFSGDDITDVLAAVIGSEPNWSLLPGDLSPTLHVFLRRCLQKDPKQRVGDIHAPAVHRADAATHLRVSSGRDRPPIRPRPPAMTPTSSSRPASDAPLRVGISSCLLGDDVRFDGGHKHDTFLVDTLSPFVQWVRVCPEVEAGFGTPREAMRLVREGRAQPLRLVTTRTRIDLTNRLRTFSARRVEELENERLCGYVLKKDSPSCGMERVKIYHANGMPARTGRGLFAEALLARYPALPVEEEGRLSDPRLRENFIERLFAYGRVRDLFSRRWRVADLVAFHAAHKLVLMAHSPDAYRRLGRLVAGGSHVGRAALEARYTADFMSALSILATPARHTNVLQHMAGYFKTTLDRASKAELQQTIEDYRQGFVPLIVPITLIRHHVRQHDARYLPGQVYLEPHPKEMMLRNHV